MPLSVLLGQRLVSFVVGVLRLEPVRGSGQYGSFAGIEYLTESLFGVTVNAAMGIANQVQSAVYSFVGNFQTAFNPQIVKSYASGDRGYFIDLIMRTSKYSYYLLYVISLPLYLCCEEVLALWLGEVPTYTVSFVGG